jgi:hypothetical protein
VTVALQTITLSIDPVLCRDQAPSPEGNEICAFCGVAAGRWARGCSLPDSRVVTPACALCALPQHLERPRIDEEAVLVWLPEISQPALNAIMREIHIALQARDEEVHADAVFREQKPGLSNLYQARAVLTGRRAPAEARLGSASPRALGLALLELSPAAHARRGELLEGVRLLPLGRFFEDEVDVYPEIVAFWRDAASDLNGAR